MPSTTHVIRFITHPIRINKQQMANDVDGYAERSQNVAYTHYQDFK